MATAHMNIPDIGGQSGVGGHCLCHSPNRPCHVTMKHVAVITDPPTRYPDTRCPRSCYQTNGLFAISPQQ